MWIFSMRRSYRCTRWWLCGMGKFMVTFTGITKGLHFWLFKCVYLRPLSLIVLVLDQKKNTICKGSCQIYKYLEKNSDWPDPTHRPPIQLFFFLEACTTKKIQDQKTPRREKKQQKTTLEVLFENILNLSREILMIAIKNTQKKHIWINLCNLSYIIFFLLKLAITQCAHWAKTNILFVILSPNMMCALVKTENVLTLTMLNYFVWQWKPEGFFHFEILRNVFVSSFWFIWIPMLWVYDH